jgi:hypothetical protein
LIAALALACITLTLLWRIHTMSVQTDRLTASVAALTTAVDAATAEISALQAGTDDAVVSAAADAVDAATAKLTAAVPAPAPAAS